jgi:hypothetical protein
MRCASTYNTTANSRLLRLLHWLGSCRCCLRHVPPPLACCWEGKQRTRCNTAGSEHVKYAAPAHSLTDDGGEHALRYGSQADIR